MWNHYSWLGRLKNKLFGTKINKHYQRQSRPWLEVLEDRTLLSGEPLGLASLNQPGLTVDPELYDPSRILVRFRSELTPQSTRALSTILGPTQPALPDLREVQLSAHISVEKALAAYRADPNVLYAEPDYRVQVTLAPNDPKYPDLWGMSAIDAPAAWDVTTGSSSTLVAVIDTGVDYNHPDLAANMWTNPGETPGDGIDNDANGFIDDVHGYDFANNDGDPMDDHFHGTHVAGTIGAVGNNNVGVVGVNWNVKIMALKFLNNNGSGSISDAIRALNYSVAMGATISNNSWGGGGFSQALLDAIQAAQAKGHIFVAAAGNNANDNDLNPTYPANYDVDNVITVAATDQNDNLAWFSNYGAGSVDLAAPGVGILSTFPTNLTTAMQNAGFTTNYGTISGTSMATPHVTGVVALVRSLHSDWTYDRIIKQIMATLDPLASFEGVTISDSRLNAAGAVGPEKAPAGARVLSISPSHPGGPVSHIRITFNKSVDTASFTTDDLGGFTGPGGTITPIGIAVVPGSANKQFDISFPMQFGLRDYSITLGPSIFSASGGVAMDQNLNGFNGEVGDSFTGSFSVDRIFSQSSVFDGVNDPGFEPLAGATDPSGNSYLTGGLFIPVGSSGGYYQIVVAKYSSNGNLLWLHKIGQTGSNVGIGITYTAGQVLVTGGFDGTEDFDPGPETFFLTSQASTFNRDAFLLKLDSDGNFLSALDIGYTQVSGVAYEVLGRRIAVDSSGNIYVGGESADAQGKTKWFVLEVKATGGFGWLWTVNENVGLHTTMGLALDNLGNIFVSGIFYGTVDFDPGPGIVELSSGQFLSGYCVKLSSNGAVAWARNIGDLSGTITTDVAVDSSGNLYCTGQTPTNRAQGLKDFNDVFLWKMDGAGNVIWKKTMGGESEETGKSIFVSDTGFIYLTGAYFSRNADFDPDPASRVELTNAGTLDVFVAKYDPSGNLIWVQGFGGPSDDYVQSLFLDSNGFIYTLGLASGPYVDFDPGNGTFYLGQTGAYNYVSKLIEPINTPPVLGGIQTGNQLVNDNATIQPFSNITISDPDPQIQTVSITYTGANGTFINLGGFTGSAGNYSFTASASAAQTALRALLFQPTTNQVSVGSIVNTTFTVAVSDGTDTSSNNQTKVVATSVNDVPSLGGINTSSQAVNDNATISPFSTITLNDPDPGQTQTVTVTYLAANGSFSNLGGFSGSAGSYTFSGSLNSAQSALRGLLFQPASNQVNLGSTITTAFMVNVSDGTITASNAQTKVVATSVNDGPIISGVTALTPINDKQTAIPFSGLSIADLDNPAQTLTLNISLDSAAKGSFTAASLNASGFSSQGNGVFQFLGTATQATSAIRLLVFAPGENRVAPGSSEDTRFTISVDDLIAAPVTNNTTVVQSTSVNDAPNLSGINTSNQAVNDNATISPFSAVTLTDPDPGQMQTVTVTYTAANGSFPNLGGFTGSAGSYTFSGSVSAAQTALRALLFQPSANQVNMGFTVTTAFTMVVSDGTDSASNNQTQVVATSVNDAPIISGVTALTPINDKQTATPFSGVNIADPENPPQTLTVRLSLDSAAKGSFTAASLSASGFINKGDGVYQFPGTATQATSAIRQLVFAPAGNRVAPGNNEDTRFTISVDDLIATPVTNNTTVVRSTSVNDIPTLSGINASSQGVNDNATISPFSTVILTDPDPGQTQTVTVTYTGANGSFTNLGGFSGSAGNYSFNGSVSAAQTALGALVFQPTINQVSVGSTVTTAFTVAITDGTDPASNNQTQVVATSVNDAPTISGVTALTPISDKQTATPFSGVSIADLDNPAQTLTVRISLDSAAKGSFTAASLSASGFSSQGNGVFQFHGTAAQATSAIRQLVFAPEENRVMPGSSEDTTFSIIVNDAIANPVANNSSVVRTTSFNDALTLGGINTSRQAVDDDQTITPFGIVTLTDPDPGQMQTVTVTYTEANGTFSNLGGFTGVAGNYSFTATPSAVQTALQGLVFQPTANQVSVGFSVITVFILTANDGQVTVSDNQATVVSTSVNDAPLLDGIETGGRAIDDDETVAPFSTITVVDPDLGQTLTVTITFETANGTLTNLGGFTGSAGNYSMTGSPSAVQAALRGLMFHPTANQVPVDDIVRTEFTITAGDGTATVSDNQTFVETTSIPHGELTVTTVTKNVSLKYNSKPQKVTFNATVTSDFERVNVGNVTFTVEDSNGKVIGTPAISGTVKRGKASASYILPGGTAGGTYRIIAIYREGIDFSASGDDIHTLIVRPATTRTTVEKPTAISSSSVNQTVLLSATVTSSAGVVNGGSVTFTVLGPRNLVIGTAVVSQPVANGQASASFILPGGTGAFRYTVRASYIGTSSFLTSVGTNKLVVVKASLV